MSNVSLEDLVRAGTHFGHLTRRWNPKMRSFIFMERNGIHIIDLKKTKARLDDAAQTATRMAKSRRNILFVGTKKQARDVIRAEAERCGMPFVTERWLGGMLTNFQTIRQSIRRMESLARQESDGTFDQLKKKERLMRMREREKLERTLAGISKMPKLPDAVYVVDINREHIAVSEARKLNIPIIAMVDTNCDPDLVDHVIPSNDDALKSILLVTSAIADAILEGHRAGEVEREAKEVEKEKRKLETADAAEAAKAEPRRKAKKEG